MPISLQVYETVSDIVDMTDDQLFVLAATELKGDAFYADQRSDDEKKDEGKDWFDKQRDTLRKALCNPSLELFYAAPTTRYERFLLICVIGDSLSGAVVGISPFTAAALTVSHGLKALCKE
jgi:hypothetical protein